MLSKGSKKERIHYGTFKTKNLELKKADKIVYDQKKKQITVTGLQEFSFSGAIQVKDKGKKRIFKYTLGEKIAYLE